MVLLSWSRRGGDVVAGVLALELPFARRLVSVLDAGFVGPSDSAILLIISVRRMLLAARNTLNSNHKEFDDLITCEMTGLRGRRRWNLLRHVWDRNHYN